MKEAGKKRNQYAAILKLTGKKKIMLIIPQDGGGGEQKRGSTGGQTKSSLQSC